MATCLTNVHLPVYCRPIERKDLAWSGLFSGAHCLHFYITIHLEMLSVEPKGIALIRAQSFFNCLLGMTKGLYKSETAKRFLSAGNFHAHSPSNYSSPVLKSPSSGAEETWGHLMLAICIMRLDYSSQLWMWSWISKVNLLMWAQCLKGAFSSSLVNVSIAVPRKYQYHNSGRRCTAIYQCGSVWSSLSFM